VTVQEIEGLTRLRFVRFGLRFVRFVTKTADARTEGLTPLRDSKA
jgi:hypothetical protein